MSFVGEVSHDIAEGRVELPDAGRELPRVNAARKRERSVRSDAGNPHIAVDEADNGSRDVGIGGELGLPGALTENDFGHRVGEQRAGEVHREAEKSEQVGAGAGYVQRGAGFAIEAGGW